MTSASPPTPRGSGRGLGGRVVGPTTVSAAATASDLPKGNGLYTSQDEWNG